MNMQIGPTSTHSQVDVIGYKVCDFGSLVHCSFKEKIFNNVVDMNLHIFCLKAY